MSQNLEDKLPQNSVETGEDFGDQMTYLVPVNISWQPFKQNTIEKNYYITSSSISNLWFAISTRQINKIIMTLSQMYV